MPLLPIARGTFLASLAAFVLVFCIAALDWIGPWTGLGLCMFWLAVMVLSGGAYLGLKIYAWARPPRMP